MPIKDPCSICCNSVRGSRDQIQCNICGLHVHRKCSYITPSQLETIKNLQEPFYCSTCVNNEIPFSNQNNNDFYATQTLGLNADTNIEHLNITLNNTDKKQIRQISNLILETDDPDNENSNFCKYYSVDEFSNKKFSKNNFSIFHLNIASLQYHIEDLRILLETLEHTFDIISISECGIQKNYPPTTNIDLQNYNYEYTATDTNKGGTLLYISNKNSFKPRKDLEIVESKQVESTFVELINSNGKNTIVGCIYRHHTISQLDFTNLLNPLVHKLSKENKPCYITGDFNMNLLSINVDPQIEKYFDMLTEKSFMPLITLPTRVVKKSKTLIDNIFYNQFSSEIISGNITVGISDHMPQFSIIPLDPPYMLDAPKNIYRRNFKNFDAAKYIIDFNQINWDFGEMDDVNKYTTNFINTSERLLDKQVPLKKLSKNQLKQKIKPWINREILKKIRKKNKTYNKFMNEKNVVHRETLELKYKKLKNEITKLTRQNKKAYYQNYFSENSKNAKKLWAGINEIINSKSKSNFTPSCIEEINDTGELTTITEPAKVANAFNDHYVSVANKILKKRKYPGNKHFTHYLKNSNPYTFMTSPTTPQEIEDIIMVSDTSKSTGPNSIPNRILKEIRTSISTPISNLCNNSFATGKFPDILKISKVTPIHKKNSKLKVENYRPISLLSNINKIIEKIMFKRLYSFLELHNCIYELQFGFREKHSTNHALLSMTQQIKDEIDKGNYAIGIFVDFQKAFDTVNHEILLRKLQHYGIRGISNKWFQSYLSNRKQYVSINNSDSDLKVIEHGVPQGSILGPLLFLVYINDLHKSINFSTTRHFADDTNLLHIINRNSQRNKNIARKVNTDLKSLNNWLLANKISLNSAKTEMIYFRKKGVNIPDVKIYLNGIKLTPTSEVKYVGIIFDEFLVFDAHIKSLNAKLKRTNNLLAKSRHYVDKNILLQIYYSHFYSHLTLGCQLWGQKLNQFSQTFILQKNAIRLMSFAHYRSHSDPLFMENKILKLMDIVKLNNIMFVHNVINNKAPRHFANYFQFRKTQHLYPTSNNPNSLYSIPKGSLDYPRANTCIGRQTIKYICTDNWNSIIKYFSRINHHYSPTDELWLTNLSIPILKALLKKHFLEQYSQIT